MRWLIIGIIGIGIISCKDDTPYIPVTNTVWPKIPEHVRKPKNNALLMQFSHFFWNDSIDGLDQRFQSDSSFRYSFKFTNIKYVVSKLELKNQVGNWVSFPEQYGLINLQIGVDSFYLKNIPNGTYSSVRFQVGLDSLENHGDPQRWPTYHPLDPTYGQLHWGWLGGYIFHATEGKIIRSGQESGFSFHLGGLINRTTVELPIAPIIVSSNVSKICIKHDLHRFFFGKNPIDFDRNPLSSHSENDTLFISKLRGNLPQSFHAH